MSAPLRLRISLCVFLVGPGCSREPAPPPRVAARPSPTTPPAGPITPPPSAVAPGRTTPRRSAPDLTRGELAGVHYLEHMTGGARPDERVPMIVALHPMGGDPVDLLPLLRSYRHPARLILPYGHPSGGMYIWYDSVRDDVDAPTVTREADRIAATLAALAAARPTVGKPLVTGFSQGGIMTFALAVTHPGSLAAAFPISGLLPPSLYPSAALRSVPPATLPPITAFHGASDLAVPTAGARASIAELRRAGYAAELREYAGVEHETSDEELRELVEQIERAADSLVDATP